MNTDGGARPSRKKVRIAREQYENRKPNPIALGLIGAGILIVTAWAIFMIALPGANRDINDDGYSLARAGVLSPSISPTLAPTFTPEPAPSPTPQPTAVSARIIVAGDAMQHMAQLVYAKRSGDYDYSDSLKFIAPYIEAADYAFVNLETPIDDTSAYGGFPTFNAPLKFAEALKDIGFDCFTLANNHIMDRLFPGVVATLDNLAGLGVETAGAYRSTEEYNAPKIIDIKGIKVGILAYTTHVNMTDQRKQYAELSQTAYKPLGRMDFFEEVNAVKAAGAQYVMAFVHWGDEYTNSISVGQKNYAQKLADAGVDIIVGTHPHVVQPIKWVHATANAGANDKMLCIYSLGNFVSNMKTQNTKTGMLVEFTLERNAEGHIETKDIEYIPTYSIRNDYGSKEGTFCVTVPTAPYIDTPPDGLKVTKSEHSRLRTAYKTATQVVGKIVAQVKTEP